MWERMALPQDWIDWIPGALALPENRFFLHFTVTNSMCKADPTLLKSQGRVLLPFSLPPP